MKNNNNSSFIVIAGVFILTVFTSVAVYNTISNNKESNSHYVKVDNDMTAKIEKIEVLENKLTITTSGNAKEYCVKSTKTTPEKDSICWKSIKDNTGTASIYPNRKYYIWIKDSNDKISNPKKTNEKEFINGKN